MSISMYVVSLSREIDCFLKEKIGIFSPALEQKASLYFFLIIICVCALYMCIHTLEYAHLSCIFAKQMLIGP